MNPLLVISVIAVYFGLLLVISLFTSKDASSQTFFIAGKQSPWFLVAYGMIGASISGITFISVPGEVANTQFTYFQMVIGYVLAVAVIAIVLLPLYYRLNVYSIYEYLETRMGFWSYKTGAAFFLIAQSMAASFRLFLMASVLQLAFFDAYGIPFEWTVFMTLMLIWLYTCRSGIKTVVYTDIFQTTFLLLAVVLSVSIVCRELSLSFGDFGRTLSHDPQARIFDWDWGSKRNFFKLVVTGFFLTLVTNGLDQSVMQKHLTCRNLKESRKNMFWFGVMLLGANFLFLMLGLLLVLFAHAKGIAIPAKTDELYPMLAIHHFNVFAGIIFLLGISAAAYSSADSALTALTTSVCVDFLNFQKDGNSHSATARYIVHFGVAMFLFAIIVVFNRVNDQSVINAYVQYSGYTYGPLLGLFTYGMITKLNVRDAWVPFICMASPIASYILQANSESWLWGYKFGFEILLVNGSFTFAALCLASQRKTALAP